MISNLRALYDFLQTSGLLPLLDHWQGLLAGVLGLLAGLVAFTGALIAARWQVKWMRRQLADAQVARAETDRRRRSVVKWAARAEGRRLSVEAQNLRSAMQGPNDAIRRAGSPSGTSSTFLAARCCEASVRTSRCSTMRSERCSSRPRTLLTSTTPAWRR